MHTIQNAIDGSKLTSVIAAHGARLQPGDRRADRRASPLSTAAEVDAAVAAAKKAAAGLGRARRR